MPDFQYDKLRNNQITNRSNYTYTCNEMHRDKLKKEKKNKKKGFRRIDE